MTKAVLSVISLSYKPEIVEIGQAPLQIRPENELVNVYQYWITFKSNNDSRILGLGS